MRANIVNLRDRKADPVFAAIRQFKEASAALDLDDQESEDRFHEAWDALFSVVPTTHAGIRAKIAIFTEDRCLIGGFQNGEHLRKFLDQIYAATCAAEHWA